MKKSNISYEAMKKSASIFDFSNEKNVELENEEVHEEE